MDNTLRALVDLRDRFLQKNRIAFKLRLDAADRGSDSVSDVGRDLLERWYERFLMLEQAADQDIRDVAQDYPIIEAMTRVKGVGPLLAAKVVALINIERADTVSALWRYAGYGVGPDGKRERPIKGQRLPYNKRLKAAVYLVATSLLRSGSPYRRIYDTAREYYELNRPDWTKAHRHQAALRKMVKVWLSHLWITWRQLEGLPVGAPYIIGHQGHSHLMTPEEFGWPPVAEAVAGD